MAGCVWGLSLEHERVVLIRGARRCSGGDAVAGTRERDGVDVARGMESARARRGLRGGRNEGRGMRARREVWDTPSCLWMAILERRW